MNDTAVLFSLLSLDSSDGILKASTHHGTIDVYVSQLREVDLKSQKGEQTKTNIFLSVSTYDVIAKEIRLGFFSLILSGKKVVCDFGLPSFFFTSL